jgi:tRNA 2-thiouridine synthesizing protein A
VAPDPDESRQIQDLLLRVDQMRGRRCGVCGAELCGHALLFDVVAGFRDAPTCPGCIARAFGQPEQFVTGRVRDYISHRDCTRAAWDEITRGEKSCELARGAGAAVEPALPLPHASERSGSSGSPPLVTATWDAGDLGCGDLVLELRYRMKALPPRGVLHLVARDPGARADIPAWCSLTGHHLIESRHPDYHLRRKDD